MITVHRKPRKCPSCGSTHIAVIIYGMVIYSDQLKKDLDAGRVVLGGCEVPLNPPHWECTGCGQTFQHGVAGPGTDEDEGIPF